ncbi:MAG: pitrilysin family protein [Patescibacteria group bacterium]|nr:pitrilysin family protein [Patescibacteria group bacterium]
MFKKTELANGIKLVLAPLKETKAVTVLVLLSVGSRYETEDVSGVSHFVEHLLFKGTTKRPTSLDLTKELDSVGADYNAFTGKDHTGYYIKAAAEEIELAFDVLSDMLFHAKFDPTEINKERGVILEEINMYDDNPLMSLDILLEETIFGNQSLGWSIAGPKSVIKNVSREKILEYKEKFYHPTNMVLGISGSFDESQVNELVEKYFNLHAKTGAKINYPELITDQTEPRAAVKFKDTEQVQLGLAFPAYSLSDPKLYPLYLLSVIMGGNMSSRLFLSVREQNSLAYYVKSDTSAYQDVGYFAVNAGLDKSRIHSAIELILAELKKVRDEGVTAQELKSAKEFLKGRFVLQLEDSESVVDWYSKQELLLGRINTPEERIKDIFEVTADQVLAVAQEVIDEKKISLALIGPFKEAAEFKKLLKF